MKRPKMTKVEREELKKVEKEHRERTKITPKPRTLHRKESKICECCKKETNSWHIHHKNHNRKDNSKKNLEILCYKCHLLDHGTDGGEIKTEKQPYDTVDEMSKNKIGMRLLHGFRNM